MKPLKLNVVVVAMGRWRCSVLLHPMWHVVTGPTMHHSVSSNRNSRVDMCKSHSLTLSLSLSHSLSLSVSVIFTTVYCIYFLPGLVGSMTTMLLLPCHCFWACLVSTGSILAIQPLVSWSICTCSCVHVSMYKFTQYWACIHEIHMCMFMYSSMIIACPLLMHLV